MLQGATPGAILSGSPSATHASYLGNETSYEAVSPGQGSKLRPIPKEQLKGYKRYVVYGDTQNHEPDDGLNSSQLSFEDASRLHSSAIAMETATIHSLRNEKWHLSCEIDRLKRELETEHNEKQSINAKLESLQAQYESKLRILRDNTEGEIRKEALHTKELEISLHQKEAQLREALQMKNEKESQEMEVYKQKVQHFERELQERIIELESVRALHRKSEQRLMLLETTGAEKSVEASALQQKLDDAQAQVRVLQRELDERRSGAESLRAHSDTIAMQFTDIKNRNQVMCGRRRASMAGGRRRLIGYF